MSERIEAGPVVTRAPMAFPRGARAAAIGAALGTLGAAAVARAVARGGRGWTRARAQDPRRATFQHWPASADLALDVRWPVERALAFVRGAAAPGRTFTIVTRAGPVAIRDALDARVGARSSRPGSQPAGASLAIGFADGVLYAVAAPGIRSR